MVQIEFIFTKILLPVTLTRRCNRAHEILKRNNPMKKKSHGIPFVIQVDLTHCRKLLCLLFFLSFSSSIFAQAERVSGTVKDAGGKGIEGASINLKGTDKGTVTDKLGNYTLKVAGSDAVLVYSFVGYVTQEIKSVRKERSM